MKVSISSDHSSRREALAEFVMRMVAEAVKEEREACAQICAAGKESVRHDPAKDMAFWAFSWCENEIRARVS